MKIEEKIQRTTMFTDEEKTILISKLSEMNSEEIEGLEEVLDDYTESVISIHEKFKPELMKHVQEANASESESAKQWADETKKNLETADKLIEEYQKESQGSTNQSVASSPV